MTVTGIYGGSFNPVHDGHTRLGRWLAGRGLVDELWLLVTPQNPLKPASDLLADEARLRLARLAVDGAPDFEAHGASAAAPAASPAGGAALRVSDFEFGLPRPSYMVHTLAALRQTYPGREFVLVIGSDNWQRFPQWHQSAEILRHHRLMVYPRPGFPVDESTLPSGVTLVDAPLMDISSTQIRAAIAHDPSYAGQGLSPAVWHEIQAKGYYASPL